MGSYIDGVRDGVLDWLEAVPYPDEGWGRWPYHARMMRPYALQASGLAIYILHVLGRLDAVAPSLRAQAVAFFRSCQDPHDRLFKDPLEDESCRAGSHTWEQIWGQRNGATVRALDLLGAEPVHPFAETQFADLGSVDPRSWTLDQIDWRNPWAHGESWYRALRAFWQGLDEDERSADHPVVAEAVRAVEEEILDPDTGMPSRRMDDPDPSRAMAGLFKVMFVYLMIGRAVPHAERAIDFTLNLQHADGEFGFRRNMCINYDAAWVLHKLDIQLGGIHRHDDIAAAGRALAEMLLREYRKSDGAFAFHGDRCQRNHHSIRLSDESYPIGDMLGTSMSLNCLTCADEWQDG